MADELKRVFGADNVFLDIDSIAPGVKFASAIRASIEASSVVLIMIGPKWLNMKRDDKGRRLDQKDDNLRIEVETALNSKAIVIPVLVDGAIMPAAHELPDAIAELAELNACTLTDSHWTYDVEQLAARIGPSPIDIESGKRSVPAIVSLVLSTLVFLLFVEDDFDSDELLGGLIVSIVALGLSVYAYRTTYMKDGSNKVICITGMVISVLLALASWGHLSSYDDLYGQHEHLEHEAVGFAFTAF